MKKRYWIGGMSASALALVAAKLFLRPRDVDWEKDREAVFHADYSRFADIEGVRVHYQETGRMRRATGDPDSRFRIVQFGLEQGAIGTRGCGIQSYRSRSAWLWLLRETSRARLHHRFAGAHDC